MLNKNVIHGENGALIGQSGTVKFAGKWIELGKYHIKLIQAQNDKHFNFSLI